MRFSIAIPSFQQGAFIGNCLRSIEAQLHQDYEVLIADGGSTDGAKNIIADFVRRDPRFRLVSEHDNGHAHAVVKALAGATGDVLCFLNADDLYLNAEVLSAVATEFTRYAESDIVTGGGVYIDDRGAVIRRVRLRYHPFDSLEWMQWRTAMLQPATFWRRAVMDHVSLPLDAEFSFDSWFFYDAWKQKFRIRQVSTHLAGYRLHGTNKSLQICPARVAELARFEDHKFGAHSLRGRYLRAIARLIGRIESLPVGEAAFKRAVYAVVNSVSFMSAYRLPSI